MITVIIPILNEEKTIVNVVRSIEKSKLVDEIIVVDDKSVPISNVISVGDGEADICMLKFSGLGVAFCSDNKILRKNTHVEINDKKFEPILDVLF